MPPAKLLPTVPRVLQLLPCVLEDSNDGEFSSSEASTKSLWSDDHDQIRMQMGRAWSEHAGAASVLADRRSIPDPRPVQYGTLQVDKGSGRGGRFSGPVAVGYGLPWVPAHHLCCMAALAFGESDGPNLSNFGSSPTVTNHKPPLGSPI